MKLTKWNSILKLTLTFTLILSLGLMAGCGDDEESDPSTPSGGGSNVTGGTISATCDGTPVDFGDDCAGLKTDSTNEAVLAGGNGSNESILISSQGTAGSYSLSANSDASVTMVYDSAAWFCASGTLVVSTATDTRMIGTFIGVFEDVMQNTMTVTNGAFDVPVVTN